jgi:hypothetical protein
MMNSVVIYLSVSCGESVVVLPRTNLIYSPVNNLKRRLLLVQRMWKQRHILQTSKLDMEAYVVLTGARI